MVLIFGYSVPLSQHSVVVVHHIQCIVARVAEIAIATQGESILLVAQPHQ